MLNSPWVPGQVTLSTVTAPADRRGKDRVLQSGALGDGTGTLGDLAGTDTYPATPDPPDTQGRPPHVRNGNVLREPLLGAGLYFRRDITQLSLADKSPNRLDLPCPTLGVWSGKREY